MVSRPDDDMSAQALSIPAPALVIGLGSYGLEALYRLSERWRQLADASPEEPSLRSLALLHMDVGDPETWAAAESDVRRIANAEGIGLIPNQALDLLILRTIGLVRVVDGMFQVAIPRDEGPIEWHPNGAVGVPPDAATPPRPAATPAVAAELRDDELQQLVHGLRQYISADLLPQGDGNGHGTELEGLLARHRVFRKRYYDWVDLAVDPFAAAERLQRSIASDGDLARFVNPLLVRLKVGNSPSILIEVIRHAVCWKEGRTPTPWRCGEVGHADQPCGVPVDDVTCNAIREFGDALGLPRAPRRHQDHSNRAPFRRQRTDPSCPIEPWVLLSLDWQSPGWTFSHTSSDRRIFRTFPASPARFGFYDLDRRPSVSSPDDQSTLVYDLERWNEHLAARLKLLGEQAWHGLVRLWSEINRQRKITDHVADGGPVHEDSHDHTLRQSLELLSQHVIEPLLASGASAPAAPLAEDEHRCTFDEGWEHTLNTTIPVDPGARRQIVDAFDLRMQALGVRSADFVNGYEVLQRLPLTPRTFQDLNLPMTAEAVANSAETVADSPVDVAREQNEVRRWLNRHLRRMLTVQERGGREETLSDPPPYVRVYVVGDLGEPAVRVAAAALLRWLQAELLRAVRPIFQGRFDGFTRPIAVVPIFSMPHPADSVQAAANDAQARALGQDADLQDADHAQLAPDVLRQRVVHERVMLMTVHRLRRSLEVVPPQERLVFELFINSRVTDRAVLDRETSISETVSFLWLCLRNIIPELDALNQLVRNVNSDVLATFSCRELNYNAGLVAAWMTLGHARLMFREFLGVRPAADFGPRAERPRIPKPVSISAPPRSFDHVHQTDTSALTPAERPARDVQDNLLAECTRSATDIRTQCEQLIDLVTRDRQPMELLREGLSEENVGGLVNGHIQRHWRQWQDSAGLMDRQFDALASRVAQHGHIDRAAYRHEIDEIVREAGPQHGLSDLHAFLQGLHKAAELDHRACVEEVKAVAATVAGRTPPAVTDRLQSPHARVRQAVLDMPSWSGLVAGVWVAGATAALGAADLIGAAMALYTPWIPWFVGLYVLPGLVASVVTGAAWWSIQRYWNRARDEVQECLASLGKAAASLYAGGARGPDAKASTVQEYFVGRLAHKWAVFRRRRARQLAVLTADDLMAAMRLEAGSAERLKELERRSETLGVQIDHDDPIPTRDRLDRLWLSRRSTTTETIPSQLVSSDLVVHWFETSVASGSSSELRKLLQANGVFERWREEVPLGPADLRRFYERSPIIDAGHVELARDLARRTHASEQLRNFLQFHLRTVGYAAQFRGFEGFDEDGIDESGMTLLLSDELFEALDTDGFDASVSPERVDLHDGSLYLLMTALGIQERSFQNLRSFDTSHDSEHPDTLGVFGLRPTGSFSALYSAPVLQQFSHTYSPSVTSASEGKS